MNENFDKIAAALEDADFAKAVLSTESAETVQKLFADKGVNLSIEELEAVGKMLSASADDELDDNDLEQVAGGINDSVIDPAVLKRLADLIKQNPVLAEPSFVPFTPKILPNISPSTLAPGTDITKITTIW